MTSPADANQHYFSHVAATRFIIRKIFRIIDERAKQEGLDPVHHQALIQIFGSPAPIPVSQVAVLVDIAPAFASRVVKFLEEKGYVERLDSEHDRRVTLTKITPLGRQTLIDIDEAVGVHVRYFNSQLSQEDRISAMSTFAFYVGYDGDGVVHPISHG